MDLFRFRMRLVAALWSFALDAFVIHPAVARKAVARLKAKHMRQRARVHYRRERAICRSFHRFVAAVQDAQEDFRK